MSEPRRLKDGDDAMARLVDAARGDGKERVGARERIWKKVVGAPAPSRAPLYFKALAVAAALGAVLVWLGPGALERPKAPEAFATLALAAGDVQAAGADAAWSAAQVGERLVAGSRLRTAANSRAYARFASAGALFGEGTRASLTRAAGVQIQLEEGAVALSVRHGSGGLVVRAEAYTVEVTGTVFQVKVGAEKVVDVFVHEGTVQIRGPSTDVTVRAGESWSSRAGAGRGTMAAGDVASVRSLGYVGAREARLTIAKPRGAEISVDGVPLGTAPLTVLQSVGPHDVVAIHQGAKHVGRALVAAEGTRFDAEAAPLPPLAPPAEQPEALKPGEADAAVPLQQKLRTGALSAADRDTASYELARVLSRRGRNAEALTLYEHLAAGNGPWAEASLYESGRLKLRYLSDAPGAAVAFSAYRARYPKGALAPEVALSLIEAHLQSGAPDAALKEMDVFLAAFASSERVDDVRFVRATVRRDRGDCAGALGDYLTLLKHARHADDALYFAAYCAQQAGQAEAARAHLLQYVLQFPAGRHLAEARAALGH